MFLSGTRGASSGPSVDSVIMVTVSLHFPETVRCSWGQVLCPTQAPAWNLHSGLSQLSLSRGVLRMGLGTEDPIQGFMHAPAAQGASRSPRTTFKLLPLCNLPTLSGSLQCPSCVLGLLVGNPSVLFSRSAVHFLPPSLNLTRPIALLGQREAPLGNLPITSGAQLLLLWSYFSRRPAASGASVLGARSALSEPDWRWVHSWGGLDRVD